MKGISHFVSGVAAASFLPWSVEAALGGNPLYFVLGGAFGLLPDTLDFKFYRFFYRHDVYVEPDPRNPDPGLIARALADGVAAARRDGRRVRVKLNTVKRGADLWQQYRIRFDAPGRRVQVRLGPLVNTGQVPVPGTEPPEGPPAEAELPCAVEQNYDAVTTVDIFDGPTFEFEPAPDGRVVIHFLPWHRNWSHSLVVGLALGALAAPLAGWRASVVIALGFAMHIVEDQLGFMGSNLFFPLTRRRFRGLRAMRSSDALPNFLAVWVSCLLVFWNLHRRMPEPPAPLALWQLALFAGALPIALFLLVLRLLSRGPKEAVVVDHATEWGDPMVG